MKKILLFFLCFGFLIVNTGDIYAQLIYEGPEDGAGDPYIEREGMMTGNRVQLLFKNNTELGDYPRRDAAYWPKGVGGNTMHNGMALLIGGAVYITQDSIPVTNPILIEQLSQQGEIDTLFYCQTNYREEMDRDLTGQIEWGFHPAPGYMNNLSETPAMSNDPLSWPPQGWLHTGRETHWPGEWDGRFGRGQIKADLEAYIVANDAQDQEKIFDISAKHSTLGTNKEKGTGLGLILCKEFAERNHGSIKVDSEIGVGTSFKFTLPKGKENETLQLEDTQI